MARNYWWVLVIAVLVGVGAIAAWNLREPIGLGVEAVQRGLRPAPVIRFAVVGDNHGDTPIYRTILSELRNEQVDFLLNLSDTTEDGTEAEFAAVRDLEQALPFPVYHTVGSHDIKTDPTRKLFVDGFGHGPNTQVEAGPVRILILDNADRRVGFSDETLDWLSDRLAAAPDARFLLAYHRPFGLPLSDIVGDDETPASRIANEKFLARLKGYNIEYIFTAHLHTYLPYALNGIPAVVSGGGGDPAQSVLGGPENNLFHYLIVAVTATDIEVTVRRVTQRLTE